MKKYLLLLALCIGCVVAADGYKAGASPAVKGITVSPAIVQISLSRGQTSATFASQVTNNTATTAVLSLGAEDFTALNQNGGVSFLGTSPKSANNNAHGLINSLVISSPQIVLKPGQSQVIPVTIANANSLAAGGHYAALTYKLDGLSTAKGNNVSVRQTIASLIFVSTYGQGTQTTDLTTPVINSLLTSFPQTINLVLENAGNTQTTPRGIVQIFNPSSKLVSQAIINVNSGLILPQSKRLFSLALPVGNKHLWPGVYDLKILYRHDGQTSYSVYNKKFLFINAPIIAAAVALLVLLLGFAIWRLTPEALHYRRK
jgi:hypothetical protein